MLDRPRHWRAAAGLVSSRACDPRGAWLGGARAEHGANPSSRDYSAFIASTEICTCTSSETKGANAPSP